jgi:hypothetical protein
MRGGRRQFALGAEQLYLHLAGDDTGKCSLLTVNLITCLW